MVSLLVVLVLVIHSHVEDRVDVLDLHCEDSVPDGADCFVLGVRLAPGVVQVEDHVRIALPAQICGQQTLGRENLDLQVPDVVHVLDGEGRPPGEAPFDLLLVFVPVRVQVQVDQVGATATADCQEKVQLSGLVLQVDPHVMGLLVFQLRKVDGAPESKGV